MSDESEAVVLGMWDDYDREGLPGILRWAAEDAVWRPHSSTQSVFRSTADYRASVEGRSPAASASTRSGSGSGRTRTSSPCAGGCACAGREVDDSRMYWVHRVADGKVRWTASSPDLARLLADAGLAGRANEAYIAMHGTEDVA